MCLDRFLLLKVSRFSFLSEFIQFVSITTKEFLLLLLLLFFKRITKMLPVLFYE